MATEPRILEGGPPGVPADAPSSPEDAVYTEPGTAAPPDPDVELDDADEPAGPREETELEVIVPQLDPVERVLRDEKGQERTYIQKGFLHFQQMDMYGLLGRATRVVLEGDGGLSMDDMFKMLDPQSMVDDFLARRPGYDDAPDKPDGGDIGFEEAARMLTAFSKLLEQSPILLREAYCVILNVPEGHRNWAMEWALPQLDRETGQDIMNTFIDQNWGVLYGFFTEELPQVVKRAARAHQRFRESSGRRLGR